MNKKGIFFALGAVGVLAVAAANLGKSGGETQAGETLGPEVIPPQNSTISEEKPVEPVETVEKASFRNVMYYSDWSIWGGQDNFYPQDLPSSYFTHLNFAFLDFDSAGNLMFTDADAAVSANLNQSEVVWGEANAGILPALQAERGQNPNLRLGVSVGGWTKSGDFATMAANDQTRATFVAQIMKFLEYTDMDFVDIDWEYPALVRQPDYTDNQGDEGTPAASPADKENYIKLLSDLRTALDQQGERLGKTYELSVALPMDKEKLQAGIDIPSLFQIVDFANIMTYDVRGAFDEVSGHHSPLYGNPQDPMYDRGLSIQQSVEYLLEQGASKEKIVVGAAFYSRGWENIENKEVVSGLPGLFASASQGVQNADQSASQGAQNDTVLTMGSGGISGGVWAYRNLEKLHNAYPNLVEYWDDVAKAPYLYNGSAFFTYDNPKSVTEKATFVKENQLGGMISWQASNDAVTLVSGQRDELTRAIFAGLYGETPLPAQKIVTKPLDIATTVEANDTGITITLKNQEILQETNGVLKAVEAQKETVLLGKLYIDAGEADFRTTGNLSSVQEGDKTLWVVDFSMVYEQRFLIPGQSLSIRLNYQGENKGDIQSITLAQRVTQHGAEISHQVMYGEGMVTVSPSISQNAGENGQENGNPTTTPNPSESIAPSTTPIGTAENPVVWSREEEAKGLYATGSVVSHQGKIYEQVSTEVLWWDEPSANSAGWKEVGSVEGYQAPDPEPWSREQEALGAHTPGVLVEHKGKIYRQVGGDTSWWCEPGTDEAIWKEQ